MLRGAGQATQVQGGGLMLPPDYDPATDALWLADQPNLMWQDVEKTTQVSQSGDPVAVWQSVEGYDFFIGGTANWNGFNEISLDQSFVVSPLVPDLVGVTWGSAATYTIIAVDQPIPYTGAESRFLGLYGSFSSTNPRGYWDRNKFSVDGKRGITVADRATMHVLMAVLDHSNYITRVDTVEYADRGAVTSTVSGLIPFAARNPIRYAGHVRAFWFAPDRAFNAAQRAANEAAMATLCQLSWEV